MDKNIHDIHILKNGEEMKVYREIVGSIYVLKDRIEIVDVKFSIPCRTIIMLPFDLKEIKVVID